MLPAALIVSVLMIAPASSGNLLLKDVSSWDVDLDWTEVLPGLEYMIHARYHNVSLLFATDDPLVLRVVSHSFARGTVGLRGYLPGVGDVEMFEQDRVAHLSVVAKVTLDAAGNLASLDAVLSLRTLAHVSITVDGIAMEEDMNLMILAKIRNGQFEWIRIGVPMGWPFQLDVPLV